MTPRHLCLSSLLLVTGCPAMAADSASIHINGRVIAGTCTTAGDASVVIPDIQGGRYPAGRISASAKAFTMVLSGCAGVTQATLSFGSANDAHIQQKDTFRNQAAKDAVGGVSLWLQYEKCAAERNTIAPGSTRIHAVNGASLSVPLCVTYWKIDGEQFPLAPGNVAAAIKVNITYH